MHDIIKTADQWKEDQDDCDKLTFVKTHGLPCNHRTAPVLYLVRDGRDAVLSYFHFLRRYTTRRTELYDLIRCTGANNWSTHILTWLKINPVIVKFEKLIAQPLATATHAIKALGLLLEPNHAATIMDFDQMQSINPGFFRRGKVGGWQDEMDAPMHNWFWQHHGMAMALMGYERNICRRN